jgi:signal transduction histidine kinase
VKLEEGAAGASTVPSAVDAAAYRILQEAITNVIRHVGPTRVTVALRYGTETFEIEVRDEGPRDGRDVSAGSGPGRGLRGMRERCQLLGGRLDAGPVPGAGFAVKAVLPLPPDEPVHP